MVKEDYKMDYKYHTEEFLEVAQELRTVGNIGRLAKSNLGYLVQYYEGIDYLNDLYHPYFYDNLSIQIDDLSKYVYAPKYQKDLQEYRRNKDSNEFYKLKEYENKIIQKLKVIFRKVSQYLVDSEMRPKPTKVNKKMSQIVDEEFRAFHEDLEEIGA